MGFFPYLAQISLIWEVVLHKLTFDLDLYLQGHLALPLKIVLALWRLQFWMDSFHIWYKWSLEWEVVLHVMTFDLDLYPQGHSTLTLKIVSAL